jgi:hypothetical protein
MATSLQAYDNELLAALERGLLQWLAQQVESDLRLHLHASQEPGLSLNANAGVMRSVAPLLRLQPIRLHTRILCIRWASLLLLIQLLCCSLLRLHLHAAEELASV